ncbi:MAG: CBS and ACT domain-containing protein [Syntrophobacteraceae bacterium]
MLVKEWMSTTVITVDPGTSIAEAIQLLNRHHISILPVMQGEKLVGVVTDTDLRAFGSSLAPAGETPLWGALVLERIRVEDVMSRAPITIPLDFTVEEAADVLFKNTVPGVAVVDEGNRIVGVMTQTDINRVMVSVTGLWRGGIAFGFLIEDSPGSIKSVTDILRAYGGRLASILTAYERAPKGFRRVHIRVRGLDRSRLTQMTEELHDQAMLLYMVDHRLNTREFFGEMRQSSATVQK